MTKFAFETSKKMLQTASTLMRSCVVGVPGIVTTFDPSFAVVVGRTAGNDAPPSRDSAILTVDALTGAAKVFAGFHATSYAEPPVTVTAPSGAVTVNGPAAVVDVTIVEADAIAPPPARLSRAVTWKV